jgi:hypothetical protein
VITILKIKTALILLLLLLLLLLCISGPRPLCCTTHVQIIVLAVGSFLKLLQFTLCRGLSCASFRVTVALFKLLLQLLQSLREIFLLLVGEQTLCKR